MCIHIYVHTHTYLFKWWFSSPIYISMLFPGSCVKTLFMYVYTHFLSAYLPFHLASYVFASWCIVYSFAVFIYAHISSYFTLCVGFMSVYTCAYTHKSAFCVYVAFTYTNMFAVWHTLNLHAEEHACEHPFLPHRPRKKTNKVEHNYNTLEAACVPASADGPQIQAHVLPRT